MDPTGLQVQLYRTNDYTVYAAIADELDTSGYLLIYDMVVMLQDELQYSR